MRDDDSTLFCVIKTEDGEITQMLKTRVQEGETVLVDLLTFDQAVQTQYALRRGIKKVEPRLVTGGSGPRFLYADSRFAWLPCWLVTGELAWLRRVMRMRFHGHMAEFHQFSFNRYAPIGNPITG